MSDPVLALVLLAVFFAAITLAHAFKSLDAGLWRDAPRTTLVVGVAAGFAARFVGGLRTHAADPGTTATALGVLLTLAALYLRLVGSESEPSDGMALGAITGAAAAVPLVVDLDSPLIGLASSIAAGAIAGFGITFGVAHVREKGRQAVVDAVTALLAIGGAYLPLILGRSGVAGRPVAIAAVAIVPLLVVATVFKQWPAVTAELRDEASLGVVDESDIRPATHPLLRLGRGGWHDAGAHREFVRVATKIALRKRQQRGRPEEIARLYQVEVIKLRMQAQEMSRIDRAMRAAARERSDTIPPA